MRTLFLIAASSLALALSTAAHSLGDCPDGFSGSMGNCNRFVSVVELPGLVDTLDNKAKSIEVCKQTLNSNSNDIRICEDQSVSFVQPEGLSFKKAGGGRYLDIGACGPTAVANVLCMQCRLCEKPISWLSLTGLQKGGGTKVEDLHSALNSEHIEKPKEDSTCPVGGGYSWVLWFKKTHWYQAYFSDPTMIDRQDHPNVPEFSKEEPTLKHLEYLTLLYPIQTKKYSPSRQRRWNFNPVLVFLDDRKGGSHVTTVIRVDTKEETVTHNTWGRQYVTPWTDFKRLWSIANFGTIHLLPPEV